jgi:hypothetical protein
MNSWFHEMRGIFWLADLLPTLREGLGHAMAQVVSYRLQNSATRVRSKVKSCDICDGQCDIGKDVLQALQFVLPICILSSVLYIHT